MSTWLIVVLAAAGWIALGLLVALVFGAICRLGERNDV